MNREEIISTVSMSDVLTMYGLKARRGMISCPFHGRDNHPSMKIYKDGFNCFACGVNGDIFKFVQLMDDCDFKTAFIRLGGTYDRDQSDRDRRIAELRRARAKKQRAEKEKSDREFHDLIAEAITICQSAEPLSDLWVECKKWEPAIMEAWERSQIEGKEVKKTDVVELCRRIVRTAANER